MPHKNGIWETVKQEAKELQKEAENVLRELQKRRGRLGKGRDAVNSFALDLSTSAASLYNNFSEQN